MFGPANMRRSPSRSRRACGRTELRAESEGFLSVAVLVVGVGFELLWRLRHATDALVRDY
jgi:hypothetical protein